MPTYAWDVTSKRFKFDGRYVPGAEVEKMLGIAVDAKAVTQLTRDYKQGIISKETWHQSFRQMIKDRYIQAGLLAAGGRDEMTPQRWGSIGGHISEQFWHLDRKGNNFLDQIDDLTEAQAVARARMYIESSRQAYETINKQNKVDLGAVLEKWVLGPKKNCIGCIELSRMGRVLIGTLGTVPGAGKTPCFTNCGCRIAYYNSAGRTLSEQEVALYLFAHNIGFEYNGQQFIILGSAKSGNWGHAGRPGKRGGSASSGGSFGAFNVMGLLQNAGQYTKDELVKQLTIFTEIPTDDENNNYYTHAVRWDDQIDSIIREGVKAPDSGLVYTSRGLVRDRGGGYVIVRADKNDPNITEGVDVVEKGLSYPEFVFKRAILPEDVVRVVREVTDSTGFRIREDALIKYALKNQGLNNEDVKSLPSEYQKLFDLDSIASTTKLGSAKSGNYGHAGRPGRRGGSSPRGYRVGGPQDSFDYGTWWRDQDSITIFHGTSVENLEKIQKEGFKLSTEGYTKGQIYFTTGPVQAWNYSVMGGEVGARGRQRLEHEERVVIALQVSPKDLIATSAWLKDKQRFSEVSEMLKDDPTFVDYMNSVAGELYSGIPVPKETIVDVFQYPRNQELSEMIILGSAKSGNWGHAGRPGKRGGSVSRSTAMSIRTGPDWEKRQAAAKQLTIAGMGTGVPADVTHLNAGATIGDFDGQNHIMRYASYLDELDPIRGEIKAELIGKLAKDSGLEEERVQELVDQWAHTSNDDSYASLHMQEMAAKEFGASLSPWQKDKLSANELENVEKRAGIQRQIEEVQKRLNVLYDKEDRGDREAGREAYVVNENERDPLVKELRSAGGRLPSQHVPSMTNADTQRALRSMYNITQQRLKEEGIETVRLYRGADLPKKADHQAYAPDSDVGIQQNALSSWSTSYDIAGTFGSLVVAMDVPINRILSSARTGYGCLTEGEFVILGGPNDQVRVIDNSMYRWD